MLIGVQKSGTSALYYNLCLHPAVACAAVVKEPFYLSQPQTEAFVRTYGGLVDRGRRFAFQKAYLAACFNMSKVNPGQVTLEVCVLHLLVLLCGM
jgi:hypothetical protein